MTLDEAVRWLKARCAVRCDGAGIKWTLTDVTAVLRVLEEVRYAE